MTDPADTPTEAARLSDKKPRYSSLPAVVVPARRRETMTCDLARLSAMAVGGHCFKNALASLQPLLQLGAARYGALMAAIGAPGATGVLGCEVVDIVINLFLLSNGGRAEHAAGDCSS